jgi:hypothetical protein
VKATSVEMGVDIHIFYQGTTTNYKKKKMKKEESRM